MNKEELILRIPENWSDINIGQFQEFMAVSTDATIETPTKKIVKQVSILTDEDESLIYELPATALTQINNELKGFQIQPTSIFKNIIEVGGKRYGFQKDLNELTLGEWIDLEAFVTSSPIDNLHKITAILYRPIIDEGDEFFSYKIKPYKDINLNETANLFQAKVSVQDVYGIVVFFFSFVQTLLDDMSSSSKLTNKEIQKQTRILKKIITSQTAQKKKRTPNKKKKTSKSGSGNISSGKSPKGT